MRPEMQSQALYYRTWGEARSRSGTLLLIHPLGADHRFWNEASELLGRTHFCLAADLRSAGRSPVAAHPISLDEHVSDLDQLCETLPAGPVTVIGCAVGAVIAAAFAARASAQVEAVVLSSPTVSFTQASRDMMAKRIAFAQESGMDALAPQIVERAFFRMPDDEKKWTFLEMVRSQTPQGYGDIAGGISEADIAEDLLKIKCPVLILTSVNDILLPPAHGKEVAGLLSHAEVEPIEKGAHFIPYQAAPAFVAHVKAFLSRQTA
jgi:3-oxoadipate enol-lactonase